MKLLIVGCGYVGAALGKSLSKEGHEVWGLRRDEAVLQMLPEFGIKPFKADLLKPETLEALPPVDTVLFCQSPSRDSDRYHDTYVTGTKNCVEVLKKKNFPVKKVIFISSTSVYSAHDGSWVDEAANPKSSSYANEELAGNAECLLEAEQAVLLSGFPANVLRLAGIYGSQRNRIKAIREGSWVPPLTDVHTNRIHIEDVVAGIRLLIEKGTAGEIYLGVDDEPCMQREFYTWLYGKLGTAPPTEGGKKPARSPLAMHQSNKRCSNKKIKVLGLKLKYPTFREGYSSFL